MGLYFLVGVARSGKSSIAKRWLNYEIDIDRNKIYTRNFCKQPEERTRMVVNGDQIRLTLHGQPFVAQAEPIVATIKDFITKLYLNSGYDVLVDGTHTTAHSIRKVLEIDNDADFYLVDTSIEECQKRAIQSNQPYLITKGVIERMDAALKEWKDDPITFVDSLRK